MDPKSLQKKFPVFSYTKYSWSLKADDLMASWVMGSKEYQFHPRITILAASPNIAKLPKQVIDNFVFHLGLMEIFSYWKAFCSPVIEINCGYLDGYQVGWWKDLLIKGMGQYFYENKIKTGYARRGSWEFSAASKNDSSKIPKAPRLAPVFSNKVLIPVSGGKDSVVTLELLKRWNLDRNQDPVLINTMVLNPKKYPAAVRICQEAKAGKAVEVEREIDPLLFELNKKGFLNGHTPFTAYLSFLAVFVAQIFGFNEVIFSNERSSNEGNVPSGVNHQYSKTFEFENKFREYNERYLSSINYFSFLRPLYDLQVTKIFAKLNKYHDKFLSCNNSKRWCGECPKCLSTFVAFYSFTIPDFAQAIFGMNLFAKESLIPFTRDALGLGEHKPFECIGTFEETKVAFYLSFKKTRNAAHFPLLSFFKKNVLDKEKNWEKRVTAILDGWDDNNNLPHEYSSILRRFRI